MKQILKSKHLILFTKQGKLGTAMINQAILAMVMIVVLFKLYADLVPEAQTAGNEMNSSNLCVTQGFYWNTSDTPSACNTNATHSIAADFDAIPLAGIFSGSGVVFIVIMAALIIVVVKSFLSGKK